VRNSPDAESLWGAESPINVTSTFFNTVNLLPKELSFEHWGAKLASCPGRHLTSLRPWFQHIYEIKSRKYVQFEAHISPYWR